jgi:hypothetical protein
VTATATDTDTAATTAAVTVHNNIVCATPGHYLLVGENHIREVARLFDNVGPRDRHANDIFGLGKRVDGGRSVNDGGRRDRGRLNHGCGGGRHGFGSEQGNPSTQPFQVEPFEAGPRSFAFEDKLRLVRIGSEHFAYGFPLDVNDPEIVQLSIGCVGVELDLEVEILQRPGGIAGLGFCVAVGVALRDTRYIPGRGIHGLCGSLGNQDHRAGEEKHESTHRTNLLVAGSRLSENRCGNL